MTAEIFFKTVASPIGELVLGASDRGCCLVEFADEGLETIKSRTRKRHDVDMVAADNGLLDDVEQQLNGYFAGSSSAFDLPLDLRGTRFQETVWRELLAIPYGQTRTYGEIAKSVGNPRASQAVGRANGRNPVAILVPCHRVIQKGGGMCGYGGGVWRKEFLLDLERSSARAH